MKNHKISDVISSLNRKKIEIDLKTRIIKIPKNNSEQIGNKSYGMIDFLVNHNGYKFIDLRV